MTAAERVAAMAGRRAALADPGSDESIAAGIRGVSADAVYAVRRACPAWAELLAMHASVENDVGPMGFAYLRKVVCRLVLADVVERRRDDVDENVVLYRWRGRR